MTDEKEDIKEVKPVEGKMTQAIKQRIVHLYNNGCNAKAIAKTVDRPIDKVEKVLA